MISMFVKIAIFVNTIKLQDLWENIFALYIKNMVLKDYVWIIMPMNVKCSVWIRICIGLRLKSLIGIAK